MQKQLISNALDTVVSRLAASGIASKKTTVRTGTIGEYEQVHFEPKNIDELGIAWDATKGMALDLIVHVTKAQKERGAESVAVEILHPASLLPESKRVDFF
jgi:hypothetical protein